jgi:hypothetical protein
MIAKWLVSAHGGFLLMESTDETLASKYSPRSVTKRMKLAEVRAFLWLERAHDYLDVQEWKRRPHWHFRYCDSSLEGQWLPLPRACMSL